MTNEIDSIELIKSKPYIIVEILEYAPDAVLIKTIVKKTTGDVKVVAVGPGEELCEKTSPFNRFIQIIEGSAQVKIWDKKYKLGLGQGIIIPAHSPHCIIANEQFKIISTIVKTGYEDCF